MQTNQGVVLGRPIIWIVAGLWACTPAVGQPLPQRPRPEPLRMAGGDHPAGAHQQPLDNTLEGSATQRGFAPGWQIINGSLQYDREAQLRGTSLPPTSSECANAHKRASQAKVGSRAVDPRCPPPP